MTKDQGEKFMFWFILISIWLILVVWFGGFLKSHLTDEKPEFVWRTPVWKN